jgi:hypothetical protein
MVNTVLRAFREIYLSFKNHNWDDINVSVAKLILLVANYYILCALRPGFNFK